MRSVERILLKKATGCPPSRFRWHSWVLPVVWVWLPDGFFVGCFINLNKTGWSALWLFWFLFSQWLEEKILSLNNLSFLNWFWDQGNVDQHYDCFDFFLAIFLRMSTLNLRLAECNTWNLKELRNESNVISNVTWWVILRQLHET